MNILFIIFSRPEETRKVFEAIRQARPERLFIAADGPRNPDEEKLCSEARSVLNIDWPCEVLTRFQEANLGCRLNVSSSIDWFFENVNEGVILEDDCLPDPTFFTFAGTMLDTYRNDGRVMHISGANFQFGTERGDGSYYFSRSPHIWGWATWKRAWDAYDVDMKDLNSFIESKKIFSLFKDPSVARFWISLFKHIKEKNIDTWDAQWAYAIMKSEGLAVTPNANLVENIGFGSSSTHTNDEKNTKRMSSGAMGTITPPQNIVPDLEADDFLAKKLYMEPIWKKLLRRLKIR